MLRANIDLLASTEEEDVWLEGGGLAAAVQSGCRAKEAPVSKGNATENGSSGLHRGAGE